jgi:A/G-specific adenine glycosylase
VPRSPHAGLQRRLLAWFNRHRRDLPWRRNRDPYRVWVSEVMLQQTTVAAVVPYFERFLAAFPTPADLAAADEQQVLRLWEGLGYYRRARHLHAAARALVRDHGGTLPDDPEVWAELPGVGRYILGAVLSQAFDRRLPVVEANTRRVICRLFGRRGDPASGPVQKWLWETADELLPPKRVGDFNQAMMELGALVCTPTAPRCGECPVAAECVAHREGTQHEIPTRTGPTAVTAVEEVAVVVRDGPRVLVARRPDGGRWAGMWEFPRGERRPDEDTADAAVRLAADLAGLRVTPKGELTVVRHAVTRFRIRLACVEARLDGGAFASSHYTEGRWLPPDELSGLPVSTPQRKLIAAVLQPERQRELF